MTAYATHDLGQTSPHHGVENSILRVHLSGLRDLIPSASNDLSGSPPFSIDSLREGI